MSQLEYNFRLFLSKHPEIEKCYSTGIINRRSLARYLIEQGLADKNQLVAVIAMLRRFEFREEKEEKDIFRDVRINIKDKILILDLEKSKELLKELQKVIAQADYDRGDTLKIVVGSSSIKLFIDKKNEKKLKSILERFKHKKRFSDISELSLLFPEKAVSTKGILSTITRELSLNNISITEFLTASPELLIYMKEDHVIKAYEIIKRLQKE
jgi:hypothetical protein